jgi:hypothetical protein
MYTIQERIEANQKKMGALQEKKEASQGKNGSLSRELGGSDKEWPRRNKDHSEGQPRRNESHSEG